MAYITKTDVANFLGVTLSSTEQTQVDAIIPGVEAFVDDECNRKFSVSGNQTEVFDGGSDLYFVKYPPIDQVVGISNDGTALTSDEYYVYPGYIRLASRSSYVRRGLTIVYTSSITVPADLKQAIVRWVAEIFKSAPDAGKTAKRLTVGPVTAEFLTKDGVPAFVEKVLNRHRLMPV